MNLDKRTVMRTVELWSIEHSEKILSDAQKVLVAKSLYERLCAEGVTEECFKWASRKAGTFCRFFPKTADVMVQVEEYRKNPPRNALAISEATSYHDPTPAEIERNMELIDICKLALCGKITHEEAAQRQEELIGQRDRNL